MSKRILLLGSTRQVGKDTLCQRLTELDDRFFRFSHADQLKSDLSTLIRERFGFDIFNCTSEQKELVRPILIAYGMCQRATDPDYWVKRTMDSIERHWIDHPLSIPVIADTRFMNEITLIKERYPDSVFVHLERAGAPPPMDEEAKHWPALMDAADYITCWGNNTEEEQRDMARNVARWMGIEI